MPILNFNSSNLKLWNTQWGQTMCYMSYIYICMLAQIVYWRIFLLVILQMGNWGGQESGASLCSSQVSAGSYQPFGSFTVTGTKQDAAAVSRDLALQKEICQSGSHGRQRQVLHSPTGREATVKGRKIGIPWHVNLDFQKAGSLTFMWPF